MKAQIVSRWRMLGKAEKIVVSLILAYFLFRTGGWVWAQGASPLLVSLGALGVGMAWMLRGAVKAYSGELDGVIPLFVAGLVIFIIAMVVLPLILNSQLR